jgi:hypothetical protein
LHKKKKKKKKKIPLRKRKYSPTFFFIKYALRVFHSSQHYNTPKAQLPAGPPGTGFATNTNSARPRHLKDIFSFTLIICDHLLSAPRATLSRTIHAPHVAPSRDIFEIKFTREDNLVQKNVQAFSNISEREYLLLHWNLKALSLSLYLSLSAD